MALKDPVFRFGGSVLKLLRRNRIVFFIVLLLLVLGYILNVYSNYIFKSDAEWVAHTIRVTNQTNLILLNQKECDVGIHGIVLSTSQDEKDYYISHYTSSLAKSFILIDSLKSLIADNPLQETRIKKLDSLILLKSGLNEKVIESDSNPDGVQNARGQFLVLLPIRDSIQHLTDQIIATEAKLLSDREANFNKAFQTTSLIDVSLFLFTCIIFIFLYNILARELKRRISNEKKLRLYEEELQKKITELQKSNEDLEQFAFIASHDLQEPLRKIRAFGDRLKMKFDGQIDDSADEYIQKMQNASARMSGMIKDLLDYSRISDSQEYYETANLSKIVADVLQDFEFIIQSTKAHVECSQLPAIKADVSQMERLFSNIISNALKFCRRGVTPEIKIWSDRVKGEQVKGLIPYKKYCCISISDNGIGFDELNLDKIFTLFKRLHGRSEYEGTGIGLAICKKIAINHSGMITAKSSVGEGTTFLIYLPETDL